SGVSRLTASCDTKSVRVQKSGGRMARQQGIDDLDRLGDGAAERRRAARGRVAQRFRLDRVVEQTAGKRRDIRARTNLPQSLRGEDRLEGARRIVDMRP